jgi:hypothetical protein
VADQEDVRRIVLSLPETSEDPNGFRFFVRGKHFVWSYLERVDPKRRRVPRDDAIGVYVGSEEDKQTLLAMDPDVFFTTDHYHGYPAVLVWLPRISIELLEQLLTDAWRSRAPRRLVRELDARSAS